MVRKHFMELKKIENWDMKEWKKVNHESCCYYQILTSNLESTYFNF